MEFTFGEQPVVTQTDHELPPFVELTKEYIEVLKPENFNSRFFAAIYPTSHNQWAKFCVATGRTLPSDSGFGRGQLPVANIRDIDVCHYLNWLTQVTKVGEMDAEHEHADKTFAEYNILLGLPELPYVINDDGVFLSDINVKGFRLPSIDQWEFLKADAEDQIKEHGLDAVAVHPGNSNQKPALPGTKMPNKYGLYDMIGNFLEVCVEYVTKKD